MKTAIHFNENKWSLGVIVLSLLLLGVVALDARRLACVVHCVKRFIQRRFK
jgi:hypothetical protein